MLSEYSSLVENETWELVPPPTDKNIVGSRWVLRIKRGEDGAMGRFKARLVAQSYSQIKGTDYDKVFSPVARHTSLRSLLALANAHDLEIHQMDVKTAFLNGTLDCEIFMSQPEGFVDPKKPDYVCKLKKSIYGLKQSARCWNVTLDEYLRSNGYRKSNADDCLYVKSIKKADGHISFVILGVYVDDIIPVSNDISMLNAEKTSLCQRFKMVDQGEVPIAAAVGILSQYMSRPSKDHWIGVKRVLRYLKGTLTYGLTFFADQKEPELFGFSDADWAGDIDTRRSTSGYVFKLGKSTVSWSSQKQATGAKPSTEAECVALSSAAQEAVWLRRLMDDLHQKVDEPTIIFEDNQGAIEMAKNPKNHKRTKHIDICHHFVRERVMLNEIKVIYCPTEDMVANVMIKGLPKHTFEKLRNLLGLYDI